MSAIEKVYCVYRNSDMTDGKGPMVLTHICLDYKLAQEIADDMEPYGYSGQFCSVEKREVTTKYINKKDKEKIKQKALEKLSYEEKSVLGLLK